MIVIPTHACSADDGRTPASDVYGDLDRDNVATCTLRVRWGTGERGPGCGARIALCHGCGLRTRINGAACGTCGGDERPEVMHAVRRDDGQERGAASPGGSRDVERRPVAEVDGVSGAGARPVVPGDRPGQGSNGPRRSQEAKAPSKPRAPAKRVKKGAAAPDGPGLPLFK